MRVASDDQIRPGIDVALCQRPLIFLGHLVALNAPVDQNHNLLSLCMAFCNLRKQRLHRNLIGGQHARVAVRSRPACLRDHAGCPNQCHPLSVFLKHHRLFCRV